MLFFCFDAKYLIEFVQNSTSRRYSSDTNYFNHDAKFAPNIMQICPNWLHILISSKLVQLTVVLVTYLDPDIGQWSFTHDPRLCLLYSYI